MEQELSNCPSADRTFLSSTFPNTHSLAAMFFDHKNYKLRVLRLIILCTICLQFSCGQEYKMTDMFGKEVSVTTLINSGKFKPIFCQERLDKLIEINPILLDKNYEDNLQNQFSFWLDKYNQTLKTKKIDTLNVKIDKLFEKTKYQYSYIIDKVENPIKVYRTDILINQNRQLRLFIRADNNNELFERDYKTTGWVINECDSINSVITDLP